MNSIVQNPTPKDSEGFFLCGGTLTTLLLRARKTQGDNKPKEMFSEISYHLPLINHIEYDEKNNDNEGYERAKTMRDDFQELHDKFDEDFDEL